jgi:uncharacterized membrane protein (UPF0127 family)
MWLTGAPLQAATSGTEATLEQFPRSTLELRNAAGRQWLKIYVASSSAQQERGLMFVKKLPADEGMLFPLPAARVMSMWMKNTLIPLDMVFIDAKGRIVCLRENTEPLSLAIISCNKPVKAVLEIGGGEAKKRGIAVGDSVVHPSVSG